MLVVWVWITGFTCLKFPKAWAALWCTLDMKRCSRSAALTPCLAHSLAEVQERCKDMKGTPPNPQLLFCASDKGGKLWINGLWHFQLPFPNPIWLSVCVCVYVIMYILEDRLTLQIPQRYSSLVTSGAICLNLTLSYTPRPKRRQSLN